MALVQLTGGAFQDAEGDVLNNGWLTMSLSHDEQDPSTSTQIAAGIPVKIFLDNNGNVAGIQSVWATDVLLPNNAYYIVEAFRSDGSLAWLSPQNQTVPTGSSLNIGTWIPNQPGVPPTTQTITLQTNGVNNSSQTLENLAAGSNITLTNVGGTTTIAATGGGTTLQGVAVSSSVPRTGDTLRYNEYGDSKWDITNGYPLSFRMVSTLFGTAYDVNLTGSGTTPTPIGTQAGTAATATEPRMQNASRIASSDAGNIAIGVLWPNGGAAAISFGTIRRWQARCRLNNTSSVRYWIGLSEFVATIATSAWHTDTPNMNYAAFRFSATTDSVIQAVSGTSNVLQTVASTGIAVDTTNTQLFEIVTDGTNIYYYINGALVATISTNMMPASTLVLGSIVGDNKSTATAMSQDTAHMIFTVK